MQSCAGIAINFILFQSLSRGLKIIDVLRAKQLLRGGHSSRLILPATYYVPSLPLSLPPCQIMSSTKIDQ